MPARWESLLRGLELLREEREAAGPGACDVVLCMVLMRSNFEELPGFVELAHRHGARA